MSHQFYSSDGTPIELGRTLGKGGEGAVLEVIGHHQHVAKIYHNKPTTEKAAKLTAMVKLKTERLLKLAAWPIDTLHEKNGGAVKGFVMPKVIGHRDVHILYGIKSRHAEYPDAKWPFLIQAAANVARAFSVIHENHLVIGDVNHGGVVVSNSATARLVDCDSFQVSANGHIYLCEVGVPTHTPPELQGIPFTGVVRTQDHDSFGLAVIIFQLLFMGRHPFSGAFLGRGDMPIEKTIQQNRFAYGPTAVVRQMKQPPATLPLEAVSTTVAKLFERAFLSHGSRPRAQEWIGPLIDLSRSLKQCLQNSGHSYLATLNSCPWCEIERRSGVVVFYPIYVAGVATATGSFNITAIWTQIESVPPPPPLSALPLRNSLTATPSIAARQIKNARRKRCYVSTITLATVCVVLLILPLGGGATFFLILLAAVAAAAIALTGGDDSVQDLQHAQHGAVRAWTDIERRWPTHDTINAFHSKLVELKNKKTEYQNLPAILQRRLQQLEKGVRQRQLERFLDGFRIDKAQINGIGHARQITLRSYGLETAADVTLNAVLNVPGFGPTYTAKLLAWRSNIERGFVFDPRRGVDHQDQRTVENEIQNRRAKLEQELHSGVTTLRQISNQAHSTHNTLRKSADAALKNLAQAEADLAVSDSTYNLIPVLVVFVCAVWALFLLRTDFSESRSRFPNESLTSVVTQPSPVKKIEDTATVSPAQIVAQAKSAYDSGVALAKAKKFLEAEAAYEQATTLRPDFAEAYHELGYVRFTLDEFDGAIAALTQARTLRPKHAETSRMLGQVYEAKENWSEAAKYYRDAAVLQPNHATTQYNLGRALIKLRNIEVALQALQEAVKLKPNWAAAHYELGLAYLEAGEPDLAREEYAILTTLDQKLADDLFARIY
jgi:DNA-binding helix-hairpin-helix protein with protein kinase domain/Flp pilus assembly protein TadD